MSIRAINWALEDAPDVPPHLVGILVALASHADAEGRNIFVGQERLAWYARKNKRNARRDIDTLVKLGLLREGNQAAAAHLRADRRPTVYDLAMDRKRPRVELDGENGGSHTTSRKPERGVAHDLPSEDTGGRTRPLVNGTTRVRGVADDPSVLLHGGSHTTPEPKELKAAAAAARRTRPEIAIIMASLAIEEPEATKVFQEILKRRNPTIPMRFVKKLAEDDDLWQFHEPAPDRQADYSGPRCEFVPGREGTCATCDLPQGNIRHRAAA